MGAAGAIAAAASTIAATCSIPRQLLRRGENAHRVRPCIQATESHSRVGVCMTATVVLLGMRVIQVGRVQDGGTGGLQFML